MREDSAPDRDKFWPRLATLAAVCALIVSITGLAMIWLSSHYGSGQVPGWIRSLVAVAACVALGLALGRIMKGTGRLDRWDRDDGK